MCVCVCVCVYVCVCVCVEELNNQRNQHIRKNAELIAVFFI